ncbi:MAG: ABC transporter ATP-binding protein [Ignavibacteriales bacterium]|nr:ABC transporter ATP-binding protein [Ignavibacteriales bacterium]
MPSLTPHVILRTHNLSKKYKDRWAVRNLSLEVHRGDIFGFLGPNGAGKSTTIRMILSLIRPTEGRVELFGYDLKSHRSKALSSVGGIVEKPDFYSYLSAVRNLDLIGSLNGGVEKKRILEVLDVVGLSGRGGDKVKTFSHGMKQRLGIAQALLSDPELVVLDEPTSGLDPQGMKEVRQLILHLAKEQKKTVFLSSHLLNEIELVANRMAIINKGELVVQGEVKALLDEGGRYVVVEGEPKAKIKAVLKKNKKLLEGFTERDGSFDVKMDFDDVPMLNNALVKAGVRVTALVPRRSLEDFFLSITENQGKV